MIADPTDLWVGLAMREPERAVDVAARHGMDPKWLGNPRARDIWVSIQRILASGAKPDSQLVLNDLRARGAQTDPAYLEACIRNVTSDGAEHVVQLLRMDYLRRLAREQANILWNPPDSVEDTILNVVEVLSQSCRDAGCHVDLDQIDRELEEEWKLLLSGRMPGLAMPWPTIYRGGGSVERGQVAVFAGHGGSGKSCALLQWALHLARNGLRTFVFPLEDGPKIAYKRILGMIAKTNPLKARIGDFTPADVGRLREAAKAFRALPIHLSGFRGGVAELSAECRILAMRHGAPSAIFVDAFKDISRQHEGVEGDNRVMGALVDLARRMNTALVVAHHIRKPPSILKKNPEDALRIDAADLRGSARIWDDARYVLGLQMVPDGEKPDGRRHYRYYLEILKANHGYAGTRVRVHRAEWLEWIEETEDVPA